MSTTPALSTADGNKIDASTFQRLHPRAYLERFLAEGIRPDGRESEEWRQVSINVGQDPLGFYNGTANELTDSERLHLNGGGLCIGQTRQHHDRMWHQSRDRRT